MTGRKFRRKVRKRKGAVGNSRMKFGLFFGIIALTVGLGFLTARFAIGPLIGFHAEKSPIQELAERKETAEQQKQTAAAEEEASKVYPLSRTFLSNRQTVTVTFPADNFLFPIGCMK